MNNPDTDPFGSSTDKIQYILRILYSVKIYLSALSGGHFFPSYYILANIYTDTSCNKQ